MGVCRQSAPIYLMQMRQQENAPAIETQCAFNDPVGILTALRTGATAGNRGQPPLTGGHRHHPPLTTVNHR